MFAEALGVRFSLFCCTCTLPSLVPFEDFGLDRSADKLVEDLDFLIGCSPSAADIFREDFPLSRSSSSFKDLELFVRFSDVRPDFSSRVKFIDFLEAVGV